MNSEQLKLFDVNDKYSTQLIRLIELCNKYNYNVKTSVLYNIRDTVIIYIEKPIYTEVVFPYTYLHEYTSHELLKMAEEEFEKIKKQLDI